mmetsp:Transcript_11000/g.41074  ORF Transcript_11000/g.41074 Transcript_11000/m.41074 type:complete len:208 (+) Transcript_11000:2206-2829(+)|eukprot:scaffold1307_cov200-Pinguiococcus_pyrenoidosus.AAC.116
MGVSMAPSEACSEEYLRMTQDWDSSAAFRVATATAGERFRASCCCRRFLSLTLRASPATPSASRTPSDACTDGRSARISDVRALIGSARSLASPSLPSNRSPNSLATLPWNGCIRRDFCSRSRRSRQVFIDLVAAAGETRTVNPLLADRSAERSWRMLPNANRESFSRRFSSALPPPFSSGRGSAALEFRSCAGSFPSLSSETVIER